MLETLEVTTTPAADPGLCGDDAGPAPRRVPADVVVVKYGRQDCPHGWVCVAEQDGHDLGPLALIDVYSPPEEGGED